MVSLQALLDSITVLSYVVDMVPTRELNGGLTKEYKVWLKPTTDIYEINILIKVSGMGTGSESAVLYNPSILFPPTPTFKNSIDAAIPSFLTANPLVEKIVTIYLDEANEIAEYYMWVKEPDPSTVSSKKRYVVFKKSGVLTLREVNLVYSTQDIAAGLAHIIEQGIGAV